MYTKTQYLYPCLVSQLRMIGDTVVFILMAFFLLETAADVSNPGKLYLEVNRTSAVKVSLDKFSFDKGNIFLVNLSIEIKSLKIIAGISTFNHDLVAVQYTYSATLLRMPKTKKKILTRQVR